MSRRVLSSFFVAFALVLLAAPAAHAKPRAKRLPAFDHSRLDALLQEHVAGGKVNYASLRQAQDTLDAYLEDVAAAAGERPLGFYVNAYNALVLQRLLAEKKLPAAVTDVRGFYTEPTHVLAGQKMSLNDLQALLRKRDARTIFVANSGAKSDPPLLDHALPEDGPALEKALERAANDYLNGKGLRILKDKKQVEVSELFQRYQDDLERGGGSVIEFLKKHVTDAARKAELNAAIAGGFKLSYAPYDWKPNSRF